MAIAEASEREVTSDHDLLRTRGPSHSPASSVAKGALALLTTQPLTWATSLVSVALLPHYLGDVALGELTLAFTVSGLAAPVVSLGLLEYLSRALAARSSRVAQEATLGWIIMTLAAMLTAVALIPVVHVLGLQVGSAVVLFAALGQIVATPTQGLLLTLLRGQERMGQFALVSSVGGSIATLVPIIVLVAGGGRDGYALATLGAFLVTLAISWPTSNIRLQRVRVTPRALLALLPAGLPFLGWTLTMQFYGQIDRILLGMLAPVQVVGWYAAASRIVGIPVFIPLLIVTPLFPALTRCKGDPAVFRDTLNKSMRAALLLTAPLCAAIVAGAPAVPSLLHWPTTFEEAIVPMAILAPTLTIIAFDMILGTALMALGHERKWLVVGIVAAVVNLTLNLLAIPLTQAMWGNGGIGASAVTLLTECVMVGGALLLMPRGLLDPSLLHITARMFVASAALVVVLRVLLDATLPFAVDVGLSAIVFVVSVALLRVIEVRDVRQVSAFVMRLVRAKI